MLKLGKGVGRAQVRRAFASRKRPASFTYTGILRAEDIREAVAGIRDARTPRWAQPLLAWLASHPNAPDDVLRDLHTHGGREVLLSLALNPKLPSELKRALLRHEDLEVRAHANHVFSGTKRH
jgi:hypothetical protein